MAELGNDVLLRKGNHDNAIGTGAIYLGPLCLDPQWSQPNVVLVVTESDEVRCSAMRDMLICRERIVGRSDR